MMGTLTRWIASAGYGVGFVLIEIVAMAVYASSRNAVAIACFEALWVA